MLATAKLPERSESIPLIWNVPLPRNANFGGREADLAGLHLALSGEDPAGRVRVVYGMAGVGKTSLVAEYAHRRRGDYKIVWWVWSDSVSSISASLSALGTKLGLGHALVEEDQSDLCDDLMAALDQRDDWLLIFDNALSPEDVQRFLPSRRRGHVLITSRSPNWRSVARAAPLRAWDRYDAIAFLRVRSGRQDNLVDASRICQALGDLPLALEQAAALIERTHLSFAGYLARFEKHWAELLRLGRTAGSGGESAGVVAMAWELSIRQVADAHPAAIDLITLCGFLHPDRIERTLLRQCADNLPEPLASMVQSPARLDEAIAALLDYSLIEANDAGISLHRLVAALARKRLERSEKSRWAEIAVRATAAAFPFDKQAPDTWKPSAAALPHALAATSHAAQARCAPETTLGLMDSVGRYLICRGQYEEAKRVLLRAIDFADAEYGPAHPRASMICNTLGRAYQNLGELETARVQFQRSLMIDQSFYGDSDLRTAAVANNLGMCLLSLGDAAEARRHFEHALGVYDARYGTEHLESAPILNNLAYVLKNIGQLETSVAEFQRALEIAEAGYGKWHPTVACILANLGVAQRARGDATAALAALERAAAIDRKVYGPAHPALARDLGHLGKAFIDAGDLIAAKTSLQRAMEIDEAAFGKTHPALIDRWQDLGRWHKANNDVDAAIRCFETAADISRNRGEGGRQAPRGGDDDFRMFGVDQ
jgi:tetratricopeptide (TPR) repeat protein